MSFNRYLNNKLHETKKTRAQLAQDIHVTNATINRWLKPYSSNPNEKSMKRVIEYFGDDYPKIHQIFMAEEKWGHYFWQNFRGIVRDRHVSHGSIPGVDEMALSMYYDGVCKYVELDDIKIIAEYLNCPVERLIDPQTADNVGYNSIDIISDAPSKEFHWGLELHFVGDYLVETTEMEPLIHYGDQISLKRDCITQELILSPQKGDIVLLKEKSHRRFLIRRLEIINGLKVYVANNAQYMPIPESQNYSIVGIVSKAITVI